MSLKSLLPLIKKTGSTLSPADFHSVVNVVFHDAEAPHYDAMHKGMWESLQQQMDLLVSEVIHKGNMADQQLHLLDIGCGTGLSTQLLLNSKLGPQISKVTLADTSPMMIQIAKARATEWDIDHELLNCGIAQITGKYDVILICSVLHHIPDLQEFLEQVNRLQNIGGIVIHLQDPNGDAFEDPEYISRMAEFGKARCNTAKPSPLKAIKKKIKRFIGKKDYIDLVNDELLKRNVIKSRMTADEIWSVTDIHVEDLPFSAGKGISLELIAKHLSEYQQITRRSYGFFGPLKSELPTEYQIQEEHLIRENQLNGRHIAATWQKTS
ncbi:MAG TPA: class I SAM-dependent methyltransferase [Flavobacterium sp.]|jgi:ubiquinone/menaquinone biosynthesis C-methylase UbiE